jgi:hypothetical protein
MIFQNFSNSLNFGKIANFQNCGKFGKCGISIMKRIDPFPAKRVEAMGRTRPIWKTIVIDFMGRRK